MKKTNKQEKKISAELKDFIKESKNTKRILKEILSRLEEDTIGRFAEGLLLPSVKKFFKRLGFEIEGVYQRARKTKKFKKTRETLEIDVLCFGEIINKENVLGQEVGKKIAFIIEAKSNLQEGDIMPFITRQIERFRDFFDEYNEYIVIGGIGGISIEAHAKNKAEEEGLYIFCRSGDNLKIINSSKFKPRIW